MSLILDGTSGLSDVDGTAGTPAIRGSDANTGVFFGTDIVGVSTGGSERMRITSSGEVLVGGSAEIFSYKGLSIQGDTSNAALLALYRNDTSIASTNDLGIIGFYGNDTTSNTPAQLAYIKGQASGTHAAGDNPTDLVFATTPDGSATVTERMRIDSSGNLLVGTTSNPDTNRVVIKGGDGNQLFLDNAGTTYTQLTFANNGTRKVRQFFDNSLTRFYIDCNGSGGVYLSSGATSWTAASDERVKDIIEPIENATQKLSAWRTVVGKYKADAEGTRRSFLIAQDVLATFPEAVDTTNADEYGLNYQDLIPVLVKAIQELKAINDAQAQTIESLTARVVALEGQA